MTLGVKSAVTSMLLWHLGGWPHLCRARQALSSVPRLGPAMILPFSVRVGRKARSLVSLGDEGIRDPLLPGRKGVFSCFCLPYICCLSIVHGEARGPLSLSSPHPTPFSPSAIPVTICPKMSQNHQRDPISSSPDPGSRPYPRTSQLY